MKGFWRYWGYIVLMLLLTAWWTAHIGTVALLILSALVSLYFLFQAPAWCCAVNRDGTLCRRNSTGLLLGCSYRQHKWQKLKLTVVPHGWRRLNRGLWVNPTTSLATIGAILGIVSTGAALVKGLIA